MAKAMTSMVQLCQLMMQREMSPKTSVRGSSLNKSQLWRSSNKSG